ncbi:MAG TPA: hypothetical protein VF645_04070 [Allosphingosinicella sp.]
MSRRLLLAGLGAGAAGVAAAVTPVLGLRPAAGPSSRPDSWWDRTFQSLQAAGLAEWSRLVGETFDLVGPAGPHRLRIAAVAAFPRSGRRPAELGRSQAFSVVFESVSAAPLPSTDRLYQLVHRSYPPLPIYMGAPFALARKSRMIAVFN